METDIEVIEDQELWDNFIDGSTHGTLAHKWNFLKTAEKHTGFKLRTYGIYNGGKLAGVFPLFYRKVMGLRMVFSPPPRSGIPYLGFAMSREYDDLQQHKKEKHLNLLVQKVDEELSDYSPDYAMFSIVPSFLDVRPFRRNDYAVEPGYTYSIDLGRPLDEIWENFQRVLKKDIKSGERQGFELQSGDDLSAFYEMQRKRYEEQNLADPLTDLKYIEDLFDHYPQNLRAYYACTHDGDVVGAMLTQEYKGKYMEWMGGIKTAGHANELLKWNLIKLAKGKGYDKYELTGANEPNLCAFKAKFNPTLEMNHTVYRKSFFGGFAEWAYLNLIKQRRLGFAYL